MNSTESVAVRVPVSMRLPAAVVKEVDAYAAKAKVRKTDAYLHFLQLGIESQRTERVDDRLAGLEASIDELLALVKASNALSNEDVASQVKVAVAAVASRYPAIERAYLFGSVARGTAGPGSDIDIRLVIDRGKKFNLHDLEHFCKAVEQKTGREVDAVTSQVIKNKSLAAAIEREKVLIYEREEH